MASNVLPVVYQAVQGCDVNASYSISTVDVSLLMYNLFDLKLFWGAKEYGSLDIDISHALDEKMHVTGNLCTPAGQTDPI
jgi:hypothetical protein